MNLIYLGPLEKGSTSAQRRRAFAELGHSVLDCPTDGRMTQGRYAKMYDRVAGKLFRLGICLISPSDRRGINERILSLAGKKSLDLLWMDKALTVERKTLARFRELNPKTVIAGYSPDDMGSKHNQSRQFLASLPCYNVYFTTKSFGVQELRSLGCPRVEFIGNAYDIHVHRPVKVNESERALLGSPVGFIGTGELARSRSCAFLAKHGVPIKVWGNRWDEFRQKTRGTFLVGGPSRYGDDYVKTICSFDINLCFLRKVNRDLQTQRSVEIPACGAFMLGERTAEHLALFEEGKEAEYFSSDEELLGKVNYYLSHPEERKRIAAAGRQRCLSSGYSYHSRLEGALGIVQGINVSVPLVHSPSRLMADQIQ